MKTRCILASLVVALIWAAPAQAEPIEDIVWDAQNCRPDPEVPTVSNGFIKGTGSVRDCKFHFGWTICLDYNGTIQPLSCNNYASGATSGSTKSIRCTPGLWATTITIRGVQSNYLERHSGFVIYTDECPLQVLGEPEP